MTEQSNEQRGGSFLVTVAALVIIAWGVYQAGSVLQLLLVSVFLAVMGTPLLFWFERKRVPSGVAVLLVVGAIIGILLVVGALVGTSLNNFSNAMPAYQARIQEQFSRLTELLASKGIESPARLALKYVNPGAVMSLTQSLLSGLSSVLSNIVLILITVTFILLEASSFPAKLRAALGVPQTAFSQLSRFVDTMKRYIIIQTATNLTEGVLDGIWFAVLGVDFPVLWGLLVFLLGFIPNFGTIIAAIPPVLLALVQLGVGRAALVAAGYIVINFLMGHIIQPRLIGRGLRLSPLIIFLSLILWGSLLGFVGMVLAVPITMTFKIAVESNASTRWIAVLLGSEKMPPDANVAATGG